MLSVRLFGFSVCLFCFEPGFPCIALAVLELSLLCEFLISGIFLQPQKINSHIGSCEGPGDWLRREGKPTLLEENCLYLSHTSGNPEG